EAGDTETLLRGWGLFLIDVNAIDRAGPGTFVAADASSQVEAVKAPVTRLHGDRLFRIFVVLRERLPAKCLQHVPEGDVHPLADGQNRQADVTNPIAHEKLANRGVVG